LDNDGKPKKKFDGGLSYYQANRNGAIVVVPALGHLYSVTSKKKVKKGYPIFDFKWVPRYLSERGASNIRIWLNVITKLAKNAEAFIDACDNDIEGSIIGYCLLRYACGNKEEIAKRMKYSTLTTEDLQESYAHLLPNLDFKLIEAGLARHEIDWLYGINLSRALTNAAKNYNGKYTILSTGRVQGPTLKFLEAREKSIKTFVPTPYWNITVKVVVNDSVFNLDYEKILESYQEATAILKACKTKEGKVDRIYLKKFQQKPPLPFDLGNLQSEAYRLFRFTPMRTSSIAQRLYLAALISYPRTSSQKLPPAICYHDILKKLCKTDVYARLASELLTKPELNPNEGKKEDPAHPAIYPTGNLPENPLNNSERNILDLIVKRFLAVFGETAIYQGTKTTIKINGLLFNFKGIQILTKGWARFYEPYAKIKNISFPILVEGQTVKVKRIILKDSFTKPPVRYNPRSLLDKMERNEIGTKATRAMVIQTLYNRKYIQGMDKIFVTDLGFEVTQVLERYCPTVISSELTRNLEEKMEEIQQGKKNRKAVLQTAIATIKPAILELKLKEPDIGTLLSQAIKKSNLEEHIIGACPKCQKGELIILRSKKTGKRFIGCTNYFETKSLLEKKCYATFPVHLNGRVNNEV
jgi:DNA topoisomerase I